MYQKFQKFGFAVDHSDHFFSAEDSAMNKPPTKDWTDRICAERTLLKQCLPQTEIFVRVYKDRLDLLRALIIGPDGTPYHNGLFIFDVCFPSTYPSRPPLVHYRSGGLSINPNMNKFGEVRLSLPKTTGGQEDMWIPSTSTMFHLLLSIQNKIFNKEPLFNDITYACMRGSLCGDQSSLVYKESVFIKTLKTMVNTMNKPPKNFENFVVWYYRDHVRDILMACKKETDLVTLKNDLDSSCTTLLVAAFKKIGAVKELEEFFVDEKEKPTFI
ncbi:ubiquitin-conjugating enzyme/RWD-like protein [Artemisia annua]|uniref:Ubiquitin-conjugating enzyme/RWD-like protein n=1 Tax=Artemisia annua TaxID=35608 RepID=A0A2U1NJ17_ARTAN|nr:ubiquitin-conjugating enzyme/RWD-like protein [Artemisia annua]